MERCEVVGLTHEGHGYPFCNAHITAFPSVGITSFLYKQKEETGESQTTQVATETPLQIYPQS
jgi:hypothetical protein